MIPEGYVNGTMGVDTFNKYKLYRNPTVQCSQPISKREGVKVIDE
jgi:hypothetical protein